MTIFLVLLYLRYRMMARGQAKVRPAQVVAHLPLWLPLLLAPKLRNVFQGLSFVTDGIIHYPCFEISNVAVSGSFCLAQFLSALTIVHPYVRDDTDILQYEAVGFAGFKCDKNSCLVVLDCYAA